MKKLNFIIGLLLSLMMVSAAPEHPFPMDGTITVNGIAQENGYNVMLENLETGEVITTKVYNGAYYFPNLNENLLDGVYARMVRGSTTYPGSILRVTACEGSPQCIHEFEVLNKDPYRYIFNVVDSSLPTKYVCSDGSIVDVPTDCPEEDEEVVDKVSSDGTTASIEAFYGQAVSVRVGNNKLSKLQDTVLEFMDEDIDVEEEILFEGVILTSIDDDEYGLDPMLVIYEGGIVYKYIFIDPIDLSEIEEDESLEINFLGKDIEIISASANEITLISGKEYNVLEGDILMGVTQGFRIVSIAEGYIRVEYGSTIINVDEGEIEKIGDVEIYAKEVFDDDDSPDSATIIIGEDIRETIEDGDEYNDLWYWNIHLPEYIGISNIEDYNDVEDFAPLKIGEAISLPEGFASVSLGSVTTPEMTDITFRVKDDYLIAEGDDNAFEYNSEEYGKILIKSTGIYNDDDELISTDRIRIGNSDTYLELGSAIIGELKIELDMSDILYSGISFAEKEESFLDHFGLIFVNAEDAVADEKGFDVSVPEERPEATIKISSEAVVQPEPPIDIPVDPEDPPVEPPVQPPIDPPVTPPVEPPVDPPTVTEYVCEDGTTVEKAEDCPEEPNNTLRDLLIGMIATIIAMFGWGKGFAGLIKYYLNKAKEAEADGDKELAKKYRERAEKMARTVITNFMAGKYKKG